MRKMTQAGRLTAFAVSLATLAPIVGFAQEAPPQGAPPQEAPPLAQAPAGDPPARVGRLAALRGAVSLLDQQGGGWIPATPNYPITTGSAVQLAGPGRAEIQVEGDRFALPGPGELDVTQLDDGRFATTLRRGEMCFSLARVPPGRSYTIQTPRGLVTIAAGGHYAVTAGDTASPTTVEVLDGAAQTSGPGLNLPVGAGQAAAITGDGTPQGSVSPAAPDQCLTDLLAEEHGSSHPLGAPPPRVVQQMTGGEELAGYGVWQPTPTYGNVWYPRVEAGWVPYRHGHWAFVPPWGWTWCDDAPWGFAPFHYGRWIDTGGRWGWAPVEPGAAIVDAPPVYAPALVSFFGIGAAALAGGALLAGSVGWVPLGPREPYYPWYHASAGYVRGINVPHVSNVSSVVNSYTSNTYSNVTVNRYVNNAGATLVPAAAMARSQPVAAQSLRLAPQQLQTAQPVLGRMAAPVPSAGVAASAAVFHVPPPQRVLIPGQPGLRIQAPPGQGPAAGALQERAVGPAGGPPPRVGMPPAGPSPVAPQGPLPPIRTPGTAAPQGVAPPFVQSHPPTPLPGREAAPAPRPPIVAAPAPIVPAAPPARPAIITPRRPEQPFVPPPAREAPAALRPPPVAAPAHVMPAEPPRVEPPRVAPPRPLPMEAPRPEPHFAPPPMRAAPPPPQPHVASPPPRPAPGREKRPGEP